MAYEEEITSAKLFSKADQDLLVLPDMLKKKEKEKKRKMMDRKYQNKNKNTHYTSFSKSYSF